MQKVRLERFGEKKMRLDYEQYKKLPKDLKEEYDYKFNDDEPIDFRKYMFGSAITNLLLMTFCAVILMVTSLAYVVIGVQTENFDYSPAETLMGYLDNLIIIFFIIMVLDIIICLIVTHLDSRKYYKWIKEKVRPRIKIGDKE